MISLIVAGTIACSGLTNTFDVYTQLDTTKNTIEVQLIDSDAAHGMQSFSIQGEMEDDCFIAPDLRLCFTEKHAHFTFTIVNEHRSHTEEGILNCQTGGVL